MRQDRRPYYIKKTYLRFRHWYTHHFITPKFDAFGDFATFMKPWYTQISGPNIRIGKCATVISERDQPVRIGVWGHEPDSGNIRIGNYVLISPGCRISACDSIIIADNVMLANGVYITDSDWHCLYDRSERPKKQYPVVIKENAWLGDGCTVLKGVTIGENSIVGARAVVSKNVPDNVIVAGNPAVVVKHLDTKFTMRKRSNFYADPEGLEAFFDQIDRTVLNGNSLGRWLKALINPTKND